MAKKPIKPIKVPQSKPRNPFVLLAKQRRAGPIPSKKTGKGGQRNEQRDLLEDE